MSQEPIHIKRYPNRRFYASHTSKYVSLPEIEEIIRAGKNVEIRDSQTGEDLTGAILMQIIADRHPEKMAVFPTAMLHSLLRATDVMSDFLREYFRSSLTYIEYLQQQESSSSLEQPMHWMQAWLDGWLPRPAPKQDDASAASQDDTSRLMQRVAELEQRLGELTAASQSEDAKNE